MEMILLDANGSRRDAVLLAAGTDRMRVALRDGKDAIELWRGGEQWISEVGSTFEIEAWIADVGAGMAPPSGELSLRVFAA